MARYNISNKDIEGQFNYELKLLREAKTESDLNKAWNEALKGLGLSLDLARDTSLPSYERNDYLGYYELGKPYLQNIYETRMSEFGGTSYPEEWQKIDEKPKHAPGYDDYVNMEKSSEEARKARNEVTSLNEQAHQIANRKKLQEDNDSGRNPRIPGSDSSQTMLTGRDRGKATMLTRGYQPRTLMGG